MVVGISGVGYPEARNITGLPFHDDIQFKRVYDVAHAVMYVRRRLLKDHSARSFFQCYSTGLAYEGVDLLHFMNVLSRTRTPWVVTYEHFLPRWNPDSRYGRKLLLSDACRRLIAMSRFAQETQLSMAESDPPLRRAVEEKTVVLHPAQSPVIQSMEEKELDREHLVCTFVGRDFFRKGGREVLRVIRRLHDEGFPIRLNLVSSMVIGDYASHSTRHDLHEVHRLIHDLGSVVEFHHELLHREVLRLLRDSHIGLLPTYDDTYGYAILESQAAGTPVITTNVCAIPEINSDEFGWVIPVEKNALGQSCYKTAKGRQKLSATIEEGLYAHLKAACENPADIRARGERSLQRIILHHTPADRADRLTGLYQAAIASM
jgi:glycosyltransferase involved in cell wall biosynthesis